MKSGIFIFIAVRSLLLAEHLAAQNLVSLGTVDPSDLYKLSNDRYVFAGRDDTYGLELWVTDGTSSGTVILKDILPGPASSMDAGFGFPRSILIGDSLLLFVAIDSLNQGPQIWATNGTPSGTFKLLDVGLPWGANYFKFYPETVNGKAFFMEGVNPHPILWVTDGTSAGTFAFNDSIPWLVSPDAFSSAILNDVLCFHVQNNNLVELWRSDGTAPGTYKITNTGPTNAGLFNLITFNNRVYFAAFDSLHGSELWSTDGSIIGTSLFKDLDPGIADSHPENFTLFQNKLFFITNSDSGGYRGTLWQSDGTSIGTTKVTLTGNTSNDGVLSILGSGGDLLYFEQFRYDSAFDELWRTDGSDSGTWKVVTFPNDGYPFDVFNERIDYAGEYYFVTSDWSADYSSLWKSDGTVQGTYSIYVNPYDPYGGSTPNISGLKVVCDSLFFSVLKEEPYPDSELELWATDGNNFDHLDFLPYAPEGTGVMLNNNGKVFLSILDTAVNNYFGVTSGLYLFNNCDPSAVTEISPDKTFEIFPNPANDKINIRMPFGTTSITIHDILGNSVKQKSIAGTNIFSTEEIDISNLAPGIYLIRLENGNDQISVKLVKE